MTAEVVFPEATKVQGNKSLVIMQDVAVLTAPDLSSEINALTSVNGTFYIYGKFAPTAEANKGSAPARLGDKIEREEFGRVKNAIEDLMYVHNPQEDDTDEANAVRAAMPEGAEVYVLERVGPDAETADYAAGQRGRIHHLRCGPQSWVDTDDSEFGEAAIKQAVSYVEPPVICTVVA